MTDTLRENATLSNQIYLSRDNVRNQIIEYLQYYLELENVDLLKSSFLTFLVDTLATLTSNVLFYSSSIYKEFFLTTAQIPDSILNLSAFLGYNASEATFATADVLINIPFGFDDANTVFYIPDKFKFYANQTEFITQYVIKITVSNNTNVAITLTTDNNKIYNLPVNIDTTSEIPSFSFILPIYQYKETVQEFQIDSDLKSFQFASVDMKIAGKISSMVVEIQDPGGASWRTYSEFNSLYLMNETDYGYVSRTTTFGRKITFGNGIIGIQPLPGSTIKVTTKITMGSDGNVIAASINRGERIYTTNNLGVTKVLNYTVINPSPATGGSDEESIEDIRKNSVAGLVTLKRLVSEYDYKNAGVVIPDNPLSNTTIPVLKRSDVKINEIQLFTIIEFGSTERTSAITGETVTGNFVVPTRNAKLEVPLSTTYVPRQTIINIDSVDYYTLFDMTIDLNNSYATYTYIMSQIDLVPLLSTSYGLEYDIASSKLTVSNVSDTGVFELFYESSELDYNLCSCQLSVLNTSLNYSMTNDYTNKKFTYIFSPYTLFPAGDIDIEFTISNGSGNPIATYSTTLSFRKNLSDFMISNVSSDSNISTIFDIPVVEKSYYDSIVQKDFELDILQNMMTTINFKTSRMMTDFTNLKFINTTGIMRNMNLNPVTKSDVIDVGNTTPPSSLSIGDRYIIGYTESGEWANKNGQIAQCTDDSTSPVWIYFSPKTNDIIYSTNKGTKYIYTGYKWILMEQQIPLVIEVEVFKSSTYYGTDIELSNLVKDTLLTEYTSRFGPNITLYRSELITTIQGITGVSHCNLVNPSSDLFYNFDLYNLTESELMEYGPEYIHFNEDSIFVRVY